MCHGTNLPVSLLQQRHWNYLVFLYLQPRLLNITNLLLYIINVFVFNIRFSTCNVNKQILVFVNIYLYISIYLYPYISISPYTSLFKYPPPYRKKWSQALSSIQTSYRANRNFLTIYQSCLDAHNHS